MLTSSDFAHIFTINFCFSEIMNVTRNTLVSYIFEYLNIRTFIFYSLDCTREFEICIN